MIKKNSLIPSKEPREVLLQAFLGIHWYLHREFFICLLINCAIHRILGHRWKDHQDTIELPDYYGKLIDLELFIQEERLQKKLTLKLRTEDTELTMKKKRGCCSWCCIQERQELVACLECSVYFCLNKNRNCQDRHHENIEFKLWIVLNTTHEMRSKCFIF